MIGDAANNLIAMNVKHAVFVVKRLIGRRFSDPVVQEGTKHGSTAVVRGVGETRQWYVSGLGR